MQTEQEAATGAPRPRLRAVGDRRLASSLVVAVVSLAASTAGGALGVWVAIERTKFGFGPPDALFANTIVLIGATLVAALGGIVGFYLAVATLPALVLWLMGWSRPMLTGLTIAAVEIVATPLMVLAMAWLSDGPASDALIPTAILLLGGVVPGLARWFAAGTPRAPLATNP